MTDLISTTQETIQNQIYTIRGKQVMMDKDLAVLYGVETKNLNKAVARNINRFPESFSFLITNEELANLRFQIGTSSFEHGGRRYPMRVFSEAGVAMLASILRSDIAIKASVEIINAFVEMRRFLKDNAEVLLRLDNVERKYVILRHETDQRFEKVFNALQSPDVKPKQGIFYDGQVFDAYVFVSDLIRSAKQSLVLINNYVDETVLSLFTKRTAGVSFSIYTQKVTSQLALDLQKHNAQYDQVVIKEFKQSHDRFLILDGNVVYHIGASLKDLGKKWFAFSMSDLSAAEMLGKLV